MLLNKHFVLAAALLVAAGASTGCGSGKKKPSEGSAKVSVSTSAVIADVGSLKLTISGAGMTDITANLTKAPSQSVWTGNISNIPAVPAPGSSRLFKAEAFRADGTKVYQGETPATVIAGQTAQVAIILQELNVPPGPTNYAPVVTSITSTNAYVLPGQTGTFSATANDPDANGDPLAFAWSASCTSGTLALATPAAATTGFTAPAGNSICTVALKVTEASTAGNNQNPLSVTTYFTVTVNANFGDADIAAFPNTFPLVSVRGDFRYNFLSDVTAMPVGQQGDLFFHAMDPDGDDVRFDLTASCGDTLAAASPIAAGNFSAVTLTTATGAAGADFNPTFGYPSPAVATYANPNHDCRFQIAVQDLCTAGNCGAAGAQGSLADGADKVTRVAGVDVKSVTTGVLNATHPSQPRRAPAIVRALAPNQLGAPAGNQSWDPKNAAIVVGGTTYNLSAEAYDQYEAGPLSVAWSCVNGTAGTPVDTQVGGDVKSLKSEITWTAPAALTSVMGCTATFTSAASSLSTVVTFEFASADACAGQADGTACNDLNACTTGETCQAGVCAVPAGGTTTCAASDACHAAGVCDPNSGVCSNPAAPDGTFCNADSNLCTVVDTCQAGVCVADPTVMSCVASGQCFDAGVCQPATGTCTNPPSAAGTTCVDQLAGAPNLCTQTSACDGAGACVGSNPVNCATNECSTGGTCQPTTGACVGGSNQPDGTACTADANLCTAESCQGGVCSSASICAAGQNCDPAAGTCTEPIVVNKLASSLNLNRIDGLGMDAAGTASFLSATSVFNPAKAVDGLTVEGAGGSDLFLARYNPVTGAPVWAKAYGDDLSQFGKDSANPTADGTVAAIGTFAGGSRLGECIAVPQPPPLPPAVSCSGVVYTNPNAGQVDYLLLANATTGAMKAGTRAINNGISGQLNAVAANPNLNLIAVCGYASGVSEIAPAGTVFAGGTRDLVIGVFNTAGVLQWSRQVGGSGGIGDEECSSIAIDDDGTVFAVGKYNANLDLGTGALPTLPNVTNVRHVWMAHFGANGATLASAAFGTLSPAPAGNVSPLDLEIDGAGDLVVGGNFTASFPVGTLVSAGGTDAFVAKFTAALAPVWGVRLGNTGSDTVNSVGFGPGNNVIAVGSYSGNITGTATTGAAALTAPGTASNAFMLKLGAATGATHFGAGYGDASIQQTTEVAVRGTRIQAAGVTTGLLDFGPPTTPMDSGTTQVTFNLFADIQ